MTSRPSSEVISQLSPLLGSLARLVASGSQVSESALQMLLLSTDLDTEPGAVKELQRWGQILLRLHHEPTAELRRASIETLVLRGLPDATVLLAVAAVADNAAPPVPPVPANPPPERELPPPTVPPKLTLSVANLDLGALAPGEVGLGELEVQGGPGQIVADSDQVQVSPVRFGPEPTTVRIAVQPLAGGLLWTSLRVITPGETREIPILVQWATAEGLGSAALPGAAPSLLTEVPLSPVIHPQPAPEILAAAQPVIPIPLVAEQVPPPADEIRMTELYTLLGASNVRQAPASAEEMSLTLAPGVRLTLTLIPAGEFLASERWEHVFLEEYWIGKYPVTNRQYTAFIQATGHHHTEYWAWQGTPPGKDDHPVVKVNWFDAAAFCTWLSQLTDLPIALPTELQWEKAARGTDGRLYPWGSGATGEKKLCNRDGTDTSPVGAFSPAGDSPYGCVDIVGNVWEWIADELVHPRRLLRGGSYLEWQSAKLSCLGQRTEWPSYGYKDAGFRISAISPAVGGEFDPPGRRSAAVVSEDR